MWPLAAFELIRRAPGSLWYRAHLRQALVLGVLVSVVVFLIMALPLALVIALGGPDTGVTLRIYAVALIVDTIVFVAAAWVLIASALSASRGESFTLPVVTALSERLARRTCR